MYGGFGSYVYSHLGGLGRVPGSTGWRNLSIAPAAFAHPAVTHASASVDTAVGRVAVDWTTSLGSSGTCGSAPENTNLTLTCIPKEGAGTFTSVRFASFGTPTGACPGFTVGACNAAASVTAVAALCVGKTLCSIPATNTFFGGDPCVNTLKHLSVELAGDCAQIVLQVSATVPVGSVADVLLKTGAAVSANVTVIEGRQRVYANGAYVPGVPGVTGAYATLDGVHVAIGSGQYVLQVAA